MQLFLRFDACRFLAAQGIDRKARSETVRFLTVLVSIRLFGVRQGQHGGSASPEL